MESEETQVPVPRDTSRIVRIVVLVLVVLYVIGSLYFIFETRSRVATLEKAQLVAADKLSQRIALTDRDVKTATEALAQKMGMTEQDLQSRMAARAAELERQQKAAEKRLTQQQKDQMSQVTGEVAGVKTDLGSTKNDLAAAKSDLEATKAKLERTIGDLGVQSGLIARTRDDLDELKKRGDKNYYEFTLQKGGQPTPISTVSLQLRKTDAKRNKFTLNVIADDRTIEKKDRTVAEPMQFYTGREHVLYELVVFSVDKNKVTGYLSTPKAVAAPVVKQ